MSLNFHITYHKTIERFSFERDQLLKIPTQRSKHKHANTQTNTQTLKDILHEFLIHKYPKAYPLIKGTPEIL